MDTTTTSAPVDPVPPEPTPPPPAPTPPPAAAPVQQEEAAAETGRPDTLSIAIGAGWGLPTSLETPNRTSLRLRLLNGLQLEPVFSISNTSSTQDSGATEATDKETNFGLAALVRFPVVTHGKVDLEILGSLGFNNRKVNPEGDYNTTTNNNFSLGYGVAVAYWFSRHWNLSMSITNPLVSYDASKQQTGPGMSVKQGDTTVGLIFVPSVFMMIHLYN